ncbi:hypothetical protein [Pedobacter sp.]|uniref:hypothetical protein n=1 Tax=Pedobacter sp. TaxID=1411316 RepID=UPI003D7F6C92
MATDYNYLYPEPQTHFHKEDFLIKEVLEDALDYLQVCAVVEDIIFSHAGLTKTWCRNNDIDLNDLENSINQKFNTDPFAFSAGIGYGKLVCQSPLWLSSQKLLIDKINDFNQVVYYTQQPGLYFPTNASFIDVLGISFIIKDTELQDKSILR